MSSGCAMYASVQQVDHEARVKKYAYLVKRIAYHLTARVPASVHVDDLIQAGMIGLLEASKNYDASHGARFETYAGIRIRGSMLDEVRGADWSPRSLHRKLRELGDAVRAIENRTGRDATDAEIAAELDISLEDYHGIVKDSATARIFSLDSFAENGQHNIITPSMESGPLSVLQDEGFHDALAVSIKKLPEREQLVMSLYYNEELNLREIGEVLDVSESRVCQIHGQALVHLRLSLTEWTTD